MANRTKDEWLDKKGVHLVNAAVMVLVVGAFAFAASAAFFHSEISAEWAANVFWGLGSVSVIAGAFLFVAGMLCGYHTTPKPKPAAPLES